MVDYGIRLQNGPAVVEECNDCSVKEVDRTTRTNHTSVTDLRSRKYAIAVYD